MGHGHAITLAVPHFCNRYKLMKIIKTHVVPGLNDSIELWTTDGPGNGGANHHYSILVKGEEVLKIRFQDGAIHEAGINGISNEVLLAVVIDRLRGFQSGAFKTKQGACALTHIEEALMWLHNRTWERLARGVEGKSII